TKVSVAERVEIRRRVLARLSVAPREGIDVDAGLVVLPFRQCRGVGLVGDHQDQDHGAAVPAGALVLGDDASHARRDRPGIVDSGAGAEIVVGVLHGEAGADVALSGGDDRDAHAWPWTQTAIVHPEELALEVGAARLPELPQDLHVLGAVFVSPCVVRLARPDAHLLVFRALPTGDDVQAATPA